MRKQLISFVQVIKFL